MTHYCGYLILALPLDFHSVNEVSVLCPWFHLSLGAITQHSAVMAILFSSLHHSLTHTMLHMPLSTILSQSNQGYHSFNSTFS